MIYTNNTHIIQPSLQLHVFELWNKPTMFQNTGILEADMNQ